MPVLRTALILAGFVYMLALPFPGKGKGKGGGFLGRGHYVSENALQPGQVSRWSLEAVLVARVGDLLPRHRGRLGGS